MKVLLVLFAITLVSVPALCDFSYCGDKNIINISSISFTPNPIVKGQSVSVSISGQISEEVKGGTSNVVVSYQNRVVHRDTKSICSQQSCPMRPGSYSQTTSVFVPSNAPSGKFNGNVIIRNERGVQISCINFDFDV